MPWYAETSPTPELDYSKPIIATNLNRPEQSYLLMPQIAEGSSYNIVGYNWFRFSDGRYNSCCFYDTAEKAVKSYARDHKIENVVVEAVIYGK